MSHRLIPRALSCNMSDGLAVCLATVHTDDDDDSFLGPMTESSDDAIDPGDVDADSDADSVRIEYGFRPGSEKRDAVLREDATVCGHPCTSRCHPCSLRPGHLGPHRCQGHKADEDSSEDERPVPDNASVVAQRGSEVDMVEFYDLLSPAVDWDGLFDADDEDNGPQPPAAPSPAEESEDDVTLVDYRPPPEPPAKRRRRLSGKQAPPTTPPLPPAVHPTPSPQSSSSRSGGVAGLYGVSDAVFRRLRLSGAPLQLFQMLYFIASTNVISQDVDFVDFYAGVGRLTTSFRSAGYRALRFEVKDGGRDQDALTAHGMLTQIVYALRCIDGKAMTHWGTVCSSWVWICRSSSGRSDYAPLGFLDRPSVKQGNCMTARMALVLWLLACKQVTWLLEQPRSSLMELHPYLVELQSVFGWEAINTFMGAFGADTQKPTKLKANARWLGTLKRKITENDWERMGPSDTAIRLHPHPCGKKRCTGSKTLKATQEYPRGYADAVLAAYVQGNADGSVPLSLIDVPVHGDNGVRTWSQFLDMTPVYVLMRMDPSFVPPGFD